ncbi:hypothetical protein [[Mycoplasma] testudinis]|uniref:hypothetical protein n=1 Tax=[Mycoplasma] testudinis TaxID=33924 RepID=UPI0004848973|nr:hypothetical protein [[Mycoplasma] testudinis]
MKNNFKKIGLCSALAIGFPIISGSILSACSNLREPDLPLQNQDEITDLQNFYSDNDSYVYHPIVGQNLKPSEMFFPDNFGVKELNQNISAADKNDSTKEKKLNNIIDYLKNIHADAFLNINDYKMKFSVAKVDDATGIIIIKYSVYKMFQGQTIYFEQTGKQTRSDVGGSAYFYIAGYKASIQSDWVNYLNQIPSEVNNNDNYYVNLDNPNNVNTSSHPAGLYDSISDFNNAMSSQSSKLPQLPTSLSQSNYKYFLEAPTFSFSSLNGSEPYGIYLVVDYRPISVWLQHARLYMSLAKQDKQVNNPKTLTIQNTKIIYALDSFGYNDLLSQSPVSQMSLTVYGYEQLVNKAQAFIDTLKGGEFKLSPNISDSIKDASFKINKFFSNDDFFSNEQIDVLNSYFEQPKVFNAANIIFPTNSHDRIQLKQIVHPDPNDHFTLDVSFRFSWQQKTSPRETAKTVDITTPIYKISGFES